MVYQPWNTHILNINKKSNQTLGLLRRNLRVQKTSLKSMAYQSLVRPPIEYVVVVWDPHTLALTRQVEMIQCRAARYATQHYHNISSVSSMLQDLGWKTLQDRRRDEQMIMLYKVVNGLVAIPAHENVALAYSLTRNSIPNKLQTIKTKSDPYRFSFFPRSIRDWNCLPSRVVIAETISQFKTELAKVSTH